MPLFADVVGSTTEPIRHHVDRRWILAYSAGIGDTSPAVFSQDAVAHPMFPVCPEWPVVLGVRQAGLTRDEAGRGVHGSHDLTIHRPVREGDDLVTTGTIVGVEDGRAGAATWTRLTTVDANGEPVATTYQRGVLLGVQLKGDPISIDGPAPIDDLPPPSPAEMRTATLEIGPQDAHIYTECARIWNPIHTEWDVATRAGLPFLLLHGTATLARAVSAVDDLFGGGRRAIARIVVRFAAPVPMPSRLTVTASPDGRFDVTLDGTAVLRGGRVWSWVP